MSSETSKTRARMSRIRPAVDTANHKRAAVAATFRSLSLRHLDPEWVFIWNKAAAAEELCGALRSLCNNVFLRILTLVGNGRYCATY
eukprot:807238-Karenia_brevis.AAC.1